MYWVKESKKVSGFGKLYIKYQYHLCYGIFTSAEYRAFYLPILLDQNLESIYPEQMMLWRICGTNILIKIQNDSL